MANNPISTPLPADLPENWVYGQTVAPQGSDAGLSNQHGYNYLMQQVNAAQEGVNTVGEAFSRLTASDVGADMQGAAAGVQDNLNSHTGNKSNPHGVTAQQAGAVPVGRKVNGKALSADITLAAADVGAVPTGRKVNGKALSADITLAAADVGALPSAGGTLSGNLTLKGSNNYGTKINFGDGDYVHISEPTDDHMEIKAKSVNFAASTAPYLKLNGAGLIQSGTSDLTAGTSTLATGCIYLVYE